MLSPDELNNLIEQAPKNEKGQPVIPDDVFLENAKNLPNGTRSESGLYAKGGGYLSPSAKGSEKAKEIASKGGKAVQEINAKRRAIAETIDIFLKKTDENGVTMQEKIVEALGLKAMDGCVGAFEALRDTVGEKPTDQLNLDVMTDKDREVLKNLTERLGLNDKS